MANHPNRGNRHSSPMTSDEFRQIRIQLGLTQSELGEIMCIEQRALSKIETGKRQPTNTQAAFIRYILSKDKPSINP